MSNVNSHGLSAENNVLEVTKEKPYLTTHVGGNDMSNDSNLLRTLKRCKTRLVGYHQEPN